MGFFLFFLVYSINLAEAAASSTEAYIATYSLKLPTASESAAEQLLLPTETATSPLLTTPDPFAASLGILSSLAIVIALIFVVSWLLQRRRTMVGGSCGRVIGILPIDPKHFIYVVDVLGRVLVLGVTEQHISMLAEITDKELIDSLHIQPDALPPFPGVEKLMGFLKGKKFIPNPEENYDSLSSEQESSFIEHTTKARNDIRRMEDLLIKRDPHQKGK